MISQLIPKRSIGGRFPGNGYFLGVSQSLKLTSKKVNKNFPANYPCEIKPSLRGALVFNSLDLNTVLLLFHIQVGRVFVIKSYLHRSPNCNSLSFVVIFFNNISQTRNKAKFQ